MSFELPPILPTGQLQLTDPGALRAIANPTRLRILSRLRLQGPATATECSRVVGESPSSCSYHLRQLARHGFVEEAGDSPDGRERRWRARGFGMRWETTGSPEFEAAGAVLRQVVLDLDLRNLFDWFDRERNEPEEWRRAAMFGDSTLAVTPAELKELNERLMALIQPYSARVRDRRTTPEGARQVQVVIFGMPLREE
jgi:DNA-binding transcriptional ArsR family regulator